MLGLKKTFFLICIFFASCENKSGRKLNLDFEQVNNQSKPIGWELSPNYLGAYVGLDSTIKNQGKYSLLISKSIDNGRIHSCFLQMPAPVAGKFIELTGFIKTENIENGFGNLWIRLEDNSNNIVGFADLHDKNITGKNDWKEFSAKIINPSDLADRLIIGASLNGVGKIWVDDLHLRIDGENIQEISKKKKKIKSAEIDTAFNQNSNILSIKLTPEKESQLTNLGMIWGFLKYYHPTFVNGDQSCDAALFRIMPACLATNSNEDFYRVISKWVKDLGEIPLNQAIDTLTANNIKLKPDYGNLFVPHNLPVLLVKQLQAIRDNYKEPNQHYYISIGAKGNPIFKNEPQYLPAYPDCGQRLISLYRYWNHIQYFYPYRHLITENWNNVLATFIPLFINAKNKNEYVMACLKLIARVHDTHANIWRSNPVLDSLKGGMITPFQAKFIENKLVVTGYYVNTASTDTLLQIGDIIEKINDVPIDSLVKKWLPFTPASNVETQLRDLRSSNGFLLRSNNKTVGLIVRHLQNVKKISIDNILLTSANTNIDWIDINEKSGFKLINDTIGYIYPAKLKDEPITSIKNEFANTKGLIIDLRCYPSLFMPFTYGAWLKPYTTPFAHFTKISLIKPGLIIQGEDVSNGTFATDAYKGKVAIIVNEMTQSQAEYTAMAFSGIGTKAIVIGSTTAGADGDVSSITLPGNISTYISGIGIYYPDLTETQRKGVKIDIAAKPTVKGIKNGIDEQLKAAIDYINR